LITVHDLQKSYGSRRALDGLSFDVRSGETLGLLGPNGAGKSTAINLIVGLLRPDQGTVRIGGLDPQHPKTRLRIGVAPQTISLYDELTGKENLEFFVLGTTILARRTATT
jgi:ABC-2 type transport system ATP-binding protein